MPRIRIPSMRISRIRIPRVSLRSVPKASLFLAVAGITVLTLWQLYILSEGAVADAVLTVALLQIVQGAFALYVLVYAWEDPRRIEGNRSPQTFKEPQYSFTALLPARNEAEVIGDTIRSIARIAYPEDKKELLVVLRDDDPETVQAAETAIATLTGHNVRIVLISGEPYNKPHHLNDGLEQASGDIVCIFDAEDEPHRDIYLVVDTVYQERGCDVVQSGVQLMNYQSNWYSLFNVLEYYLWFRSALHFFASKRIIPLGGNTVFFKRFWLERVGGWDLNCLTEDADIGIRLSVAGAKKRRLQH
jgi:cellulose synthase/poly-beta-1,6-N-acetylglucosamine synthase-like glycosyltransferase